MTERTTRILRGLDAVSAEDWDAIAGDDDPFAEHAFLRTLETSGSVGPGTGWDPRHVTVWEGERLVAAMPLYRKSHSYGEYIFDWAWADASARLRQRYYPKLVSMAPVTPATGTRFLVANDRERGPLVRALLDACFALADDERASSIHLLFLNETEREDVAADARLLPRTTFQFHWIAAGDATFDDYLGRFRSSARKQVRKERRAVEGSGLVVRTLPGDAIGPREWAAIRSFYVDTCDRKGSPSYLSAAFFDQAARTLAHRAVAVVAYEGDEPVAASLNFEKGRHLYGRYWGCSEHHEMLHFELCYYRLIERAIERGCTRFEAGAQGEHKLKRGLVPRPVHSAHWLRNPILSDAVADFLVREAHATDRTIDALSEHSPFRRGDERD